LPVLRVLPFVARSRRAHPVRLSSALFSLEIRANFFAEAHANGLVAQ